MPVTPVLMLIGEQLLLILCSELGVCIICSYSGGRGVAEGLVNATGFLCLHKTLSCQAP